MKHTILLVFLGFVACAPDFTTIKNLKPHAVQEGVFPMGTISAGYGTWNFSPETNDFARKHRITILKVRIINHTDTPWSVSPRNFMLSDSTHTLNPMSGESVASTVKLPRGKYWFWSFLMGAFVSSSCNGDDCRTTIIPIPIGFFFGLHHFFKATNYNDSLSAELKALEFRDSVLAPSGSLSGMLYFRDFASEAYELQFRPAPNDSASKLAIPLNRRYSQYLMREFKNPL